MHIVNVKQADQILPKHKTFKAGMSHHFPLNITAKDCASLCFDVLNGENCFAPHALLWNKTERKTIAGPGLPMFKTQKNEVAVRTR